MYRDREQDMRDQISPSDPNAAHPDPDKTVKIPIPAPLVDASAENERAKELRDSIVVVAFEGWNDAGDAATAAVEHLHDVWSARVIAEIDALGITDRCIVQSFDPAILEVIHAERPDLVLALLVENDDGLRANLSRLTFIPQYYSPHFSQADEGLLKDIRQDGMELVVWTVNKKEDIQRMLDLGVDGIISDYPERVIALMGDR